MIFLDSTRIKCYFNCPRSFYFNYLYEDIGLQPKSYSVDLALGSAWAKGLQQLRTAAGLNVATAMAYGELMPLEDAAKEDCRRILKGSLYFYSKYILPDFLKEWTVLAVEQELCFTLAMGVTYLTRPDCIVQREDGLVFNWNDKTSSYISDLSSNYKYDRQLMMEVECIRQTWGKEHNLEVAGTIIGGLQKGKKEYTQDRTSWTYQSPFLRAYRRIKGEPGAPVQLSLTWKAGWEKFLVKDTYTSDEWIAILDRQFKEEILKLYVVTPTIEFQQKWVEDTKDQFSHLATQFTKGNQFPQNTQACLNYGFYGHSCPFLKICHENNGDDYVPRVPNHPIEAEQWERA